MYTMISKHNCPWCDKAVDHIENILGETVKVSYYEDSLALKLLLIKSGLTTVPQIWKDKEYIGGYQELVKHLYDH